MRFVHLGLFGLVMIALTPRAGTAQTYQGGVRGAVRDADGVVPGAAVLLINEETTVERTTITNPVGEYAFPNVAPGVYTLRATISGFKTFESRGIRVGTQEFLTLDLRLEVGEVREAITVTDASPVIDSTTASVGNLIERRTLETLPNVGRNPFVISTITPNVIPTGVPQFTRMQDQNATAMLSLGGGPRRANNFLLDGVPITDLFNRAAIIPSLEAVEEVKVQVSTFDAELGRTGGGVFNTTHKSGSNAWHGSALILGRPEWGAGTLFFTKQAGQPKPETYHHQWAGSVGGPITRNRTFFWATTEGYKTQTTSDGVLVLPTEAERRGDYSQSFDAQGRLIVIHDPLTTRPNPAIPGQFIRDPFPGNVIPPARINPVARNLVNLLPLPSTGRALTRKSEPISDFTNQATGKVDHRLSDRQTLSGLFAWYHSREPQPQYLGIEGDPNALFQPRTVNVLAINDVMVPTDRTVLAVRYGYLRFRDDFASAPSDPTSLGFSPAFTSAITGFPRISVPGYSNQPTLFHGGLQTESTSYSHSATVSVSRLAGRHTIKVGGEYRRIGMRVFAPGDVNGTFALQRRVHPGAQPEHRRHEFRRRARQPAARVSLERRLQRRHAQRLLHELLRRIRSGRFPLAFQRQRQPRRSLRARTGHARAQQRHGGRLRSRPGVPGSGAWAQSQRRVDVRGCRRLSTSIRDNPSQAELRTSRRHRLVDRVRKPWSAVATDSSGRPRRSLRRLIRGRWGREGSRRRRRTRPAPMVG